MSVKPFPGLFRQSAIARTFRSIGTGAAPSTGRFSENMRNAMPPRGEPPVEGAGENPCAREAEQGGGPPPSPQPEKDLGRGLQAGEHLPVRQDQVHRRKACAPPDVRKTEGKVLRVAGEKLEIFRAGPCPDPVDSASADGALAVVDEHGLLRHLPHLQREAKKSSPSPTSPYFFSISSRPRPYWPIFSLYLAMPYCPDLGFGQGKEGPPAGCPPAGWREGVSSYTITRTMQNGCPVAAVLSQYACSTGGCAESRSRGFF